MSLAEQLRRDMHGEVTVDDHTRQPHARNASMHAITAALRVLEET